MPNALRLEGRVGSVYVGTQKMASINHWSMEMIAEGRYSFVADNVDYSIVDWPFRDRSLPIKVELPMRRSVQVFRVMLSSESPLSGEATLDANKAEEGDFW